MDTLVAGPRRSTTNKTLAHPLNAWYVAAWDYEVTPHEILARTVAGRPLALYRTNTGAPVALADACWHRLAPLSMGKRVGEDGIDGGGRVAHDRLLERRVEYDCYFVWPHCGTPPLDPGRTVGPRNGAGVNWTAAS